MVSPPFCGIGERRAEIVPQGGGRRHQTTGWYGGLIREGSTSEDVETASTLMGIRREETQSGLPVLGDADARVCPL